MTSAFELVRRAQALGAKLWVEGDRLELDTPVDFPGTMMELLRQNKPQVLGYLRQAEASLSSDAKPVKEHHGGEPAGDTTTIGREANVHAGYHLAYPETGSAGKVELRELERRVEHEGYVLLWCNVLNDLVAYYKTDEDRKKIPAGFVPYSDAELRGLFGEGKPRLSPHKQRMIHEAKKQGGRVISNGEGDGHKTESL